MNKVEISISSNGMKNLEFLPIDKDFIFIAGGKEYPTFKIVACILSPSISTNLKNNPNMNKYQLPFDDPHGYFQIIIDIAYGHDYEINLDNCFFIYRVAKVFENKGLEEVANIETNSHITEENCFQLLLKMHEYEYPKINEVESFIARNFDNLTNKRIIKLDNNNNNQTSKLTNDLLNLPIDLFSLIFQSEDFKIRSKTYNLLVLILNERPEFLNTFKKVIFDHSEELSPQELQNFVGYIDDDDFPIAGPIIKDAIMKAKFK